MCARARAASARALVPEVSPVSRLSRALRTRASQEVSVLLSLLEFRCDDDADEDEDDEEEEGAGVLLVPAAGLGRALLDRLLRSAGWLSRGAPVRSRQEENLLR